MRSFLQLPILILTAGMALAQSMQPKAVSPFEQELLSNEKQLHEALAAKNVGYVNQAVSADFRGIATNGDFEGREELVGKAREGLPKDFRAYDIMVVQLSDSSAVVTYNEIVPGSHPRYLRMSDTWSKQNGQWKLRFQQATPNLWSATDLD